jgi:imidazolonepropionase-like amidohydrolase
MTPLRNTTLATFLGALAMVAGVLGAPRAEAHQSEQQLVPRVAGDLAVRAGKLYPITSPAIRDAVVIIRDGKVTAFGKASDVAIPAGFQVVEAAVVTPGLVDAHSCVGLAGWLNTDHDKDELDGSAPVQPELRALDAYNPADPLVDWLRGFGVTTVHTGHAPGAVVSGQTMVVKTVGRSVEEATVTPAAMVACTLGDDARSGQGAPGTRAKTAAMLRAALVAAKEYADKRAAEPTTPRNLGHEALAKCLSGELGLLITAQRAQDIATALRFKREFPGLRLVIDGGAEAPRLIPELRAAGVPVIVHPTMQRSSGETENLSMETPGVLLRAGLDVALQSGYEGYVPRTRVVLFEAAIAARYGVEFEPALSLVTYRAARMLGLEDRLGHVAVGLDGDLALFDGDPFEYATQCVGTVIEGTLVSSGERARER